MAYHVSIYLFIFLPVALILYQLTPKKFRWITLLIESYVFFCLISRWLLIYLIAMTAVTYLAGLQLSRMKAKSKALLKEADKAQKAELKKQSKKQQKRFLIFAIILLLSSIVFLKYLNFFLYNVNSIATAISGSPLFFLRYFPLPIGISFYTLEAIGYVVDVYWEKIPGDQPIGKVALFLAFFPQLMEGPISMFSQTADDLWEGRSLRLANLRDGAVRILWGLFKKMIIADRLAVMVSFLYTGYEKYYGLMIIVAAVAYTIQLYMDFSGSMDIIIGTGQMFGITLPENFNQPFVSGNAAEFWRRWHMTLGVWFKTYIFYPVSTSGLVKKWNKFGRKHAGKYITKVGVSAICLVPVWLCNGLWHGASWNYIFYGVYYLIILLMGVILDPVRAFVLKKTHANEHAWYWRGPQILKTWVIIFTGELLFRAEGFRAALTMYKHAFMNFSFAPLWDGTMLSLSLEGADYVIVIIACIVVAIVGSIKERKRMGEKHLADLKLPIRWAIYYALILSIVIFGAYGVGYVAVDLIYAGF